MSEQFCLKLFYFIELVMSMQAGEQPPVSNHAVVVNSI